MFDEVATRDVFFARLWKSIQIGFAFGDATDSVGDELLTSDIAGPRKASNDPH